jgi:hypothetical protein
MNSLRKKRIANIRSINTARWIVVFLLLNSSLGYAQNKDTIKWWNPATSNTRVVDGQAWPNEIAAFYHRLPSRAKGLVRKEVWNLSQQSAGLQLRFITDSKEIRVRYMVTQKKSMDHFPVTGHTGVDLYSINKDGSYAWANGKYKFGDTITYEFSNLDLNNSHYKEGRTYNLYLPIYNTVSWLEIGVAESSSFSALSPRKEKPIVVYGTSIAQGGCASRPGMAWPAILDRYAAVPVMNFGFSGNGRLEKEVIDLINEIDASIFVLDCLPNLGANSPAASLEVQNKIVESVRAIRNKHPDVPIILAEHSGFIENRMDAVKRTSLLALNSASAIAVTRLKALGYKNLYTLTAKDINMGTDGTVDGTHPSDLGMNRYAQAYKKIVRTILSSQ